MAFLPIKPCCSESPNNLCNLNESCENIKYNRETLSDKVIYDGPTLPSSGIRNFDNLTTALSKIDAVLTSILAQQYTNTINIVSLTNQINLINSEITEINNNCCP
jgi:hypothetical protein